MNWFTDRLVWTAGNVGAEADQSGEEGKPLDAWLCLGLSDWAEFGARAIIEADSRGFGKVEFAELYCDS